MFEFYKLFAIICVILVLIHKTNKKTKFFGGIMVTKSLFSIGGVIDGVVDAFRSVGDWIVNGFYNIIDSFSNTIICFVMCVIYNILKAFFVIIDFINLIFRKMCGLDTVRIGSTYSGSIATGPNGEFEGDLALALIQSQQVIDVFISLLIVAVILLFVFTFIAIIKNQYNPEKSKGSNGPIIGTALKALFTFLFVPAICIFGVFVSNGLLKTIDGATRLSSSTSMSGQIFAASANSANRIRTDDAFWEFFKQDTAGLNPSGMFTKASYGNSMLSERDRAATAVDEAFAGQLSWSGNINATAEDGLAHMNGKVQEVHTITSFDYKHFDLVWVYYDLSEFNWLLAFVSCFFVSAALLVASIGVIQRLYEITILFAISPPFVSLMPLDGGKAFGMWKKTFIESVLIVYGTIVAINFFFIITPVLLKIDLFFGATSPTEAAAFELFNAYGHVLFIIAGALLIKDFSKMLDILITGNDKVNSLMNRGLSLAYGEKGEGGVKAMMKGAVSGAKTGLCMAGKGLSKGAKGLYKGAKALKKKFKDGKNGGGDSGGDGVIDIDTETREERKERKKAERAERKARRAERRASMNATLKNRAFDGLGLGVRAARATARGIRGTYQAVRHPLATLQTAKMKVGVGARGLGRKVKGIGSNVKQKGQKAIDAVKNLDKTIDKALDAAAKKVAEIDKQIDKAVDQTINKAKKIGDTALTTLKVAGDTSASRSAARKGAKKGVDTTGLGLRDAHKARKSAGKAAADANRKRAMNRISKEVNDRDAERKKIHDTKFS